MGDYQYFNGCVINEANLVVLAGKLERIKLFEKELKSKGDRSWEGCLFTFKHLDGQLFEQEPYVLLNTDEPIYQVRPLEESADPIILAASRVTKLFVLRYLAAKNRWVTLDTLTAVSLNRNSPLPLAVMHICLGNKNSEVFLTHKEGYNYLQLKYSLV